MMPLGNVHGFAIRCWFNGGGRGGMRKCSRKSFGLAVKGGLPKLHGMTSNGWRVVRCSRWAQINNKIDSFRIVYGVGRLLS